MERRGFFGAIVAWVVSLWIGRVKASSQSDQLVNVITMYDATSPHYMWPGNTRVITTREGKLRFERWGCIKFTDAPQFVSAGAEIAVVRGWTRIEFTSQVRSRDKEVFWSATDERDATPEEIENSKMGVYSE